MLAFYRGGTVGQGNGGLILGPVAVGMKFAACGIIDGALYNGPNQRWIYDFAGSAWALAGTAAPTEHAMPTMPAAVVTPTTPATVYTVNSITPDAGSQGGPWNAPGSQGFGSLGTNPGDVITFSTIGAVKSADMCQFIRVS